MVVGGEPIMTSLNPVEKLSLVREEMFCSCRSACNRCISILDPVNIFICLEASIMVVVLKGCVLFFQSMQAIFGYKIPPSDDGQLPFFCFAHVQFLFSKRG